LAPLSQLLYGTDFPFAPEERLRMADAAFETLPFTADERNSIRLGNARRLFATFADRCCGQDHG
jgi:predicted TIM-barrel fold metal-dependent hydrolase